VTDRRYLSEGSMALLTQATKEVAPAQLMPAETPHADPARQQLLHHPAGRHHRWPVRSPNHACRPGPIYGDPETWGPKEMAIVMMRLAGLLGDVRAASAFRYDAHDSAGNRMDT
jgi:hypothetical protein